MSDEIQFVGAGPFTLPAAQQARADLTGEGVTLAFRVILPGGTDRAVVYLPATRGVASELLGSLSAAMSQTVEE